MGPSEKQDWFDKFAEAMARAKETDELVILLDTERKKAIDALDRARDDRDAAWDRVQQMTYEYRKALDT